jgi:catechol 2,3-dioxygenase-like lactoylglutathione lyase family enzyme
MTTLSQHAAISMALVFGFGGFGILAAQEAPALDGIAHVALRVSDVAKSRAFYRTLGWEQAFEFSDDKGTATSYVKVSDRQFIELYRRDNAADPLGLMHICLDTRDVDRAIAAYAALGLTATSRRKARAGNLLFNLRDPEDQLIEFTQYLPGSLHENERGKHVLETRLSDHMTSVTLTVKNVDAGKAFFTGKLGFQGSGYKLSVPGNPSEAIELRPAAGGGMTALQFAADPKRTARELKKRGLEVKTAGGVAEVRGPDGVILFFSNR